MAKTIDTRESKVGQDKRVELPASGPIGDIDNDIEIIDTPRWDEKAKNLAFMNEIVKVRIFKTGNKNEEEFVQIGNGGVTQFIQRNTWQPVRRMFVEVLARAKKEDVSTIEYTDAIGNQATRIDAIASLQYPFEMQDSNPDGHVWLQRILAEA